MPRGNNSAGERDDVADMENTDTPHADTPFRGGWTSPAIDKVAEQRRSLEASQEWIVDTIFPAGAMHLIGGPSGVGKTTWLFQMLYQWDQGLPLFGEYRSNPVPWVYISCDRSMRETTQTLARLGYSHWKFEAYALEDLIYDSKTKKCKLPDFTSDVLERFPYAKLIVVEGLQAVMPDNSKARSQNKTELLWALEQRFILGAGNRTVIATTHNPKINQLGTANNDERSKFLGSQGFIGSCSTMIGFEKHAQNPQHRNVTVMGRNFGDMHLQYSIGDHGEYVLEIAGGEIAETEDDRRLQFQLWLQAKSPVVVKDAKQRWSDLNLGSVTSFERFINKLKADGTLESVVDTSGDKRTAKYAYKATRTQ